MVKGDLEKKMAAAKSSGDSGTRLKVSKEIKKQLLDKKIADSRSLENRVTQSDPLAKEKLKLYRLDKDL
mgnify:CR=1 FL=1